MVLQFTLEELVSKFGGEIVGKSDIVIESVASLSNAKKGQISFLTDTKYLTLLHDTRASAVIISSKHCDQSRLPAIVSDNPYAYFAKVSALFNPEREILPGISASAHIDVSAVVDPTATILENVVIGKNVVIGSHTVIGPNSVLFDNGVIGANTKLEASVTVYHSCEIGDRCVVASGAVIGADGFGFALENNSWVRIPQVGRVMIGNDVVIGANTAIDRGALDDTIIENGVKIDNLVQIGHNCKIGAHTIIAGCVGIAGSATIGSYCRIGGAAMVLGHLEIAEGITISPGSMITRSLHVADTYTALMPFQAHDDWLHTAANIRKISDLADRIKHLERHLLSHKDNEES